MSSPNKEFIEEKRKLLHWITTWPKEGETYENTSLDIPELSTLLISTGFRLEAFEKALDNEKAPSSKNIIRVELTCSSSKMRSVLIKDTSDCKCPSEEQTAEGQFWSVTGCGPSSQSSINSSQSSLLPTISSAKSKMINHLMTKILSVINDTQIVQNEKPAEPFQSTGLLTRHRSLDTLKRGEDPFLTRPLKRGPSWEVDPRTSPPTGSSSPVTALSSSLSQISLDSVKSNIIVKNLETIKHLATETMEIASGTNITFVKSNVLKKRVSDIKPTEGPSVRDLIHLDSPSTSRLQTPRKIITPRKLLGASTEKKALSSETKIATLRKKTLLGTVSPASQVSPRRVTPLTKPKLKQGTVTSSENLRFKIASSLVTKPKLSPNIPGTSGIAKLKTLTKRTPTSTFNKDK